MNKRSGAAGEKGRRPQRWASPGAVAGAREPRWGSGHAGSGSRAAAPTEGRAPGPAPADAGRQRGRRARGSARGGARAPGRPGRGPGSPLPAPGSPRPAAATHPQGGQVDVHQTFCRGVVRHFPFLPPKTRPQSIGLWCVSVSRRPGGRRGPAGEAGGRRAGGRAAALTPWPGRPAGPRALPAPQAPAPRPAARLHERPGPGAAAPPRVEPGARGRQTKMTGRRRRRRARGGERRRGRRRHGTPKTYSEESKQLPLSSSGRKSGRKRARARSRPGLGARGAARREYSAGVGPGRRPRAGPGARGGAAVGAWGAPATKGNRSGPRAEGRADPSLPEPRPARRARLCQHPRGGGSSRPRPRSRSSHPVPSPIARFWPLKTLASGFPTWFSCPFSSFPG